MDTPFKPQIDLNDVGPEVRAYIYQTITEFEPFMTPETVVSVIAKEPKDKSILNKTMYRIGISLKEDGTKLEEEGVHEDLCEAIRIAKEKMLKTLNEIQDSVVSSSDRQNQIQGAINGGSNIH